MKSHHSVVSYAPFPATLLAVCSHLPPSCRVRLFLPLRNDRLVITPAQRHERQVAESGRRVQTSLLLLAVSATAHLGHHVYCLLPPGVVGHVPLLGSLLPTGWFAWFQAGIATAALVGPGGGDEMFFVQIYLEKGEGKSSLLCRARRIFVKGEMLLAVVLFGAMVATSCDTCWLHRKIVVCSSKQQSNSEVFARFSENGNITWYHVLLSGFWET